MEEGASRCCVSMFWELLDVHRRSESPHPYHGCTKSSEKPYLGVSSVSATTPLRHALHIDTSAIRPTTGRF